MTALRYIWLIIASPSFAEQQRWVQKVAKACAIIPANGWTASRLLGTPVFIYLFEARRPILAILSFALFALTDRIDGMVARYRGVTDNGATLDGFVDKVFAIVILAYLNLIWDIPATWKTLTWYNLLTLAFFETCRGLMFILPWIRKSLLEHQLAKIANWIPEFKREDVAHAIIYGKIKFGLQVVLVFLIFTAITVLPWQWWPFWINVLYVVISVLSLASMLFRIWPKLDAYLADVASIGNAACGILGAVASYHGEFVLTIKLTLLAAICDILDGALARMFPKGDLARKFGVYLDDLADLISFAINPALALFFLSRGLWWIALIFFLFTLGRLCYFTFTEGKPDMFSGLPSPAAAVGLISFFVWSPTLPADWIGWVAIGFALLEVDFRHNWYHFKRIGGTPRWAQIATGIGAALIWWLAGPGCSLSALTLTYVTTFFRPLADRLWGWNQEKK